MVFFRVEKIECTQNHVCMQLAPGVDSDNWDEAFECALAGLSVIWAARTLTTSTATFGAQHVGPEHQDAEIVLADPLDGSAKLTNTNAAGKIVLLQRGNCTFVQKAMNAQTAGAIAVIIYNNQDGGPSKLKGANPRITIPVVSISQTDGAQLAAAIQAGRTTLSIQSASCQSLFVMSIVCISRTSKLVLQLQIACVHITVLYESIYAHQMSWHCFNRTLWF